MMSMTRPLRALSSVVLMIGTLVLASACSDAPDVDARQAGASATGEAPGSVRMYLGTYTRNGSEGIYMADLDLETGEVSEPRLAAEAENPSFLALHYNGRWLFAVNETNDFGEGDSGAISAFTIDAESGELTLQNQVASGGGAPCHIIVDAAGRHVLVANYLGGNAGAWAIEDDGSLDERTAFVQHSGSSVHDRQQAPHAHAVELDSDGRYAFVPDLGADRVFVYSYAAGPGSLSEHDEVEMEPGAGPRHMRFHPAEPYAYVINELTSTITVMSYDFATGQLEPVQTVSTLPDDFDGQSTTAEVAVHPSGEFVYGSNRGHDSLAVFQVDGETGELEPVGHVSTGGETPRHYNIDPSGQWLIAANQNSDNLVVFAIDPETGMPEPTGQTIDVPTPVCVMFAQ